MSALLEYLKILAKSQELVEMEINSQERIEMEKMKYEMEKLNFQERAEQSQERIEIEKLIVELEIEKINALERNQTIRALGKIENNYTSEIDLPLLVSGLTLDSKKPTFNPTQLYRQASTVNASDYSTFNFEKIENECRSFSKC
jgi:hypothetical protein